MSEKTSSIDHLICNNRDSDTINDVNIDCIESIDSLIEYFYNGDCTVEYRTKCIERIFTLDKSLSIECIQKIESMYHFSENKIFKNLLVLISQSSIIDCITRFSVCKTIYDRDKNTAYKCLTYIGDISTLSCPIKIEIISMCMETYTYYDTTISLLKNFFNDSSIECDYRYKTLVDLTKKFIKGGGKRKEEEV